MKSLKFALACAWMLASPGKGLANDIYVSQTGSGLTNGSSASNALAVAWMNIPAWQQPGVWGTNGIHPGDTVHLTGVITTPLSIAFSGAPGSNVTILFEPNAMLSAPTLTNSSLTWINCVGVVSNLVIDGGVNGIIQCTDNGTLSNYWDPATGAHGACDFNTCNMVGISACPANNFTVRNLTISNLYNRLRGSDDPPNGPWKAVAISVQGYNVTVQNNVIFNTQDGIDFSYSFPATSNLTVVGNSIMGFNHGIQVATSDYQIAPLFYNAIIRSNRIDGMDYYESTNPAVGDGYHMDPIFLFNTSVNTNNYTPTNDPCSYYIGCISNVDISCNFIGPGVNPQTSAAGSAGIFIHDYSTNQMDHVLIYNNILVLKPPLTYGDGFIDGGYAVNSIIANNTLIGWATNLPSGGALAGLVTNTNASSQMIFCGYPYGTGLSACGGYSVFNNVLYNMTSQIMFQGQPSTNNLSTFTTNELSYLSGLFSDYNIYQMGIVPRMRFYAESTFSFGTGPTYQGGNSIGIGRDFLPDWQALGPQFDQHSSTNVPLLDPVTYAPLSSDTVAHGQGTNLSAYFTTDFYGNPRPGGTNSWDIGALTAKAPYVAAPTGLHVIPAN